MRTLHHSVLVLAVMALSTACAQPSSPAGGVPATPPADATTNAPSATAEAAPACPAPGVLITADRGDAAMGYREMTLHLKNCGTAPYQLQGRPDIVVLDKDRQPLDVAVVPSVHYTASPRPVMLQHGVSTMAVLSWRNTYTAAAEPPATGVYLSVAPVQGAPRQTVTPPSTLDLGNTGKLEAGAWM